MPHNDTDIAVLGAGPAGAATALFLARKGYSVTLLDRAVFPRDKPCGEYLTPGAVALLRDELGVLPQLLAQGAAHLARETVVPHDGRAFGGRVNALACPRAVTDAVLVNAARAAGVTVCEGVSARRILFDGGRAGGVAGTDDNGESFTLRARVTVGADGTHSLLARALGVVRPIARLQRIALVRHYAEAPPEALTRHSQSLVPPSPVRHGRGLGVNFPTLSCEAGEGRPSSGGVRGRAAPLNGRVRAAFAPDEGVTMHLPLDGTDACCGVGAPCGPDGTRNVNIVVPVTEAAQMAGRRDAYFDECLRRSFPAVWEQVGSAQRVGPLRSVPCFGHHTARASHAGAVLVGDAATFIHPFTGEGVYFALRGAMLAADAIDAALRANDMGYLSGYDAARRQELLPRYRLCDWVQRVVHSPALLTWAAGRLRRSPALTDALLQTVGDVRAPRALLSWEAVKSALLPGL